MKVYFLLLSYLLVRSEPVSATPGHISLQSQKTSVLVRQLSANLPEDSESLRWDLVGMLPDERNVFQVKRGSATFTMAFFDTFATPPKDLRSAIKLEVVREPQLKGGTLENVASAPVDIVGVKPPRRQRAQSHRLVYAAYVAAPKDGTVRGAYFMVTPFDDRSYEWLELSRKIARTLEHGSVATHGYVRSERAGIHGCPLRIELTTGEHWLVRWIGEPAYRLDLTRRLGSMPSSCDMTFGRSAIPPELGQDKATEIPAKLWDPAATWHVMTTKGEHHSFAAVTCGHVNVSIYCHAPDEASLTRLRGVIETIHRDE